MFDANKMIWTEGLYFTKASLLYGLVELLIDAYPEDPTKGNSYQIRIRGTRVHKVATKIWLADLDAAKAKAVDALNQLLIMDTIQKS